MLLRPKMILIDLDGTLVDSVPDLAFHESPITNLESRSYQ